MDKSGPAFPASSNGHPGMTLRDYFAATVIGGLSSSDLGSRSVHEAGAQDGWAESAYLIADAMMKVRLKS